MFKQAELLERIRELLILNFFQLCWEELHFYACRCERWSYLNVFSMQVLCANKI